MTTLRYSISRAVLTCPPHLTHTTSTSAIDAHSETQSCESHPPPQASKMVDRRPNGQSSHGHSLNDPLVHNLHGHNSSTSAPISPRSPLPTSRTALTIAGKSMLRTYLPIFGWLPHYSLSSDLIGDLLAGITVGLMVVPQAMAYAQIAELPILTGLYSALFGCLLYAPFGTSKDLNVGPTSVLSLLVLSAYVQSARDEQHGLDARLQQSMFLCLYAGCFQLLFGFFKLGRILDFISHPIISAFTSASALTIASVQIKNLTGIKVGSTFIVNVWDAVANRAMFLWRDALLGAVCVVFLMLLSRLKRYQRRTHFTLWFICTARNALCVLGAMLFTLPFMLAGYRPFVTIPRITGSSPHLPSFSLDFLSSSALTIYTDNIGSLTFSAIAIACIGILEGMAVAKAFAKQNGYTDTLNPSQELIASGFIQAVTSFMGCYPVGGSFSRTAVNSQAGIRTPLGSAFAAVVVGLALLVATGAFVYIPQAALAAVIMSAVVSIIDFDIFVILYRMGEPMSHRNMPPRLAYLIDFLLVVPCGLLYVPLLLLFRRRTSLAVQAWWDLLTVEVAFWGCLLLSIEWGIALAVLLSLALTLQRSAGPVVQRLRWSGGQWKETDEPNVEVDERKVDEDERKELGAAAVTDEWIDREVLCVRILGNVMYFSIHTIQHDIKHLEQLHYTQPYNPTSPTPTAASHRQADKESRERLALGGSAVRPSLASPTAAAGTDDEDVDERVETSDVMLRSPRSEEALRELEEAMDTFELLPHSQSSLRWLLIDLVAVVDIDTSGMRGLESMIGDFASRGSGGSGSGGASVEVLFVGGQREVVGFLQRALSDEWERLGMKGDVAECFYPDLESGMIAVQQKRQEQA